MCFLLLAWTEAWLSPKSTASLKPTQVEATSSLNILCTSGSGRGASIPPLLLFHFLWNETQQKPAVYCTSLGCEAAYFSSVVLGIGVPSPPSLNSQSQHYSGKHHKNGFLNILMSQMVYASFRRAFSSTCGASTLSRSYTGNWPYPRTALSQESSVQSSHFLVMTSCLFSTSFG